MAEAAAKLFRDPQSAEKAVSELKTKGYKAGEISILLGSREEAEKFTRDMEGAATAEMDLTCGGHVFAMGKAAEALNKTTKEESAATLIELLNISEETYNYWGFSNSIGGIAVGVHADEARLPQARGIFRSVSAEEVCSNETRASSPGFIKAGRMSATDPIDAPMSGDFRRY